MKRKITALLLISAMFLSACNPTEIEMAESSEWEMRLLALEGKTPSELPDRLEAEVGEGLKIDADILVPEGKKKNEAAEVLLVRHIDTDRQMQDNMERLIKAAPAQFREAGKEVEKKKSDSLEDKKERICYDLGTVGDGSVFDGIIAGENGFVIYSREGNKAESVTRYPFDSEAVQFCFEENGELDFEKWEVAEQELVGLLDDCGVGYLTERHCYAMAQDKMSELLQKRHSEGSDFYFQITGEKAEYTKEDEAYFFFLQQGYDGIPVCKYQLQQALGKVDLGGIIAPGITAMYSTEGMICLSAMDLFDIEKSGGEQPIVPLSEILEKSIPHLAALTAGDSSVEVKEIGLSYLPVLEDAQQLKFRGIPVWTVAYIHTSTYVGDAEFVIDSPKYEVYNAFTGEQMN